MLKWHDYRVFVPVKKHFHFPMGIRRLTGITRNASDIKNKKMLTLFTILQKKILAVMICSYFN